MLFRNQAVFAVKNGKNRTFFLKIASLFLNHVHLRSNEPRPQGKGSKEIHHVLIKKRFSMPFFSCSQEATESAKTIRLDIHEMRNK